MIPLDPARIVLWIAAIWWPFVRAMAMLNAAPVFSSSDIPMRVRIGLSLFLALAVQATVPNLPVLSLSSWPIFFVISVQQLIVGIIIGFAARIAFAAVNFAGAVIGLEMGLGFATLFDPQHGVQVPTLSSFLGIFATLIFLSMNGQLILIDAFSRSFLIAPPGLALHYNAVTWLGLARLGGELFLVGLSMALPVLTVLVAANLALGVLARVAPQLNIFVVGFPVLLLLGMASLYLAAPIIGEAMLHAFNNSMRLTAHLLEPL